MHDLTVKPIDLRPDRKESPTAISLTLNHRQCGTMTLLRRRHIRDDRHFHKIVCIPFEYEKPKEHPKALLRRRVEKYRKILVGLNSITKANL
nr:hypothetical protein CFP56_52264 [Quercus suber]